MNSIHLWQKTIPMRFDEFNAKNPLHFPAKQISLNNDEFFRVVGNPFDTPATEFQYAAKKTSWQFANYLRVMYTAMRWAKEYFKVQDLTELNVFHCKLSTNKSSFSMQIGSISKSFILDQEAYHPFFQIEYGYDNPFNVKLKMGFSRYACYNGAITGYKELDHIKIHINHLDNSLPLTPCDFDYQALGLQRKIKWLKNMPVPKHVFETAGKRKPELVEKYIREIGENAFGLVNILTDLASFPNGRRKDSSDIKTTLVSESIWTPDADIEGQEHAGRLFERLAAVAQSSLNRTIPDEAFSDRKAMETFYDNYKVSNEDSNAIIDIIHDHLNE